MALKFGMLELYGDSDLEEYFWLTLILSVLVKQHFLTCSCPQVAIPEALLQQNVVYLSFIEHCPNS